jgi:hypothetical protein
MTAEPVKRSQYFNPPTTECPHSSRNHFEDWEEFHLPMARMHHGALHGRGVADGLEVSVQNAGAEVEVRPGVAVNGRGELIALAAGGQADIGIERPGEGGQQIDPPFRLATSGRDSGTYYLCIEFAQVLRFTEGSCGKQEQTPWLRLLATAGDLGPIEAGDAIVLAVVAVDAAGVATAQDRAEGLVHRRQLVGQGISDLRLRRSDTAADAVGDTLAGRIGAGDGGGLRLSVAAAADAMVLEREDGGRFSRLEVQADEARLAGNLEVLGDLGLANWRLRAGGAESGPTLDLHPLADAGSLRVVAQDGSQVPLEIRASSAGNGNAVHLVQTGGRVGIGTAAPDRALTVVGAGEAALNVRDGSGSHEVMLGVDEGGGVVATMTGHDLQLRAGSNTPVMTLKADGRVGIGTTAPGEPLEVAGRVRAGHLTVGDWPPAPNDFVYFGSNALDQNDHRNYALLQDSGGRTSLNSPQVILLKIADLPSVMVAASGKIVLGSRGGEGSIGFGVNPVHPIHLAGGAHCFEGREWRNGSSIAGKQDVEDLPVADAMAALRGLRPVTFRYVGNDEARAGFIAEEVPELLATGDRKSLSPMEIVAVLTRVVQDQQRQIRELSEPPRRPAAKSRRGRRSALAQRVGRERG